MSSFRISSIASIAIFLTTLSQADQRQRFIAQTIDDNIQIGYGLAIGDVDGDGDEDILLADKSDFVWYENPSWEKRLFWTLSTPQTIESLRDNVCIAAKDLDGDGKVEVAVGTNWNPGETVSEEKSGGVWFVGSLGRIEPVKLPHDPTTHRMGWARGEDNHVLVVVPLHGRGNQGGAVKTVLGFSLMMQGRIPTAPIGNGTLSTTAYTRLTTSIYSRRPPLMDRTFC